MSMLPLHDVRRRRDGKRANERLKLLANFLNTSGVGMLGGGVLVPLITGTQYHPEWPWVWLWIVGALALHGGGQLVLQLLMSED